MEKPLTIPRAVVGMICMRPTAPRTLTAVGSNCDSWRARAKSKARSTSGISWWRIAIGMKSEAGTRLYTFCVATLVLFAILVMLVPVLIRALQVVQ